MKGLERKFCDIHLQRYIPSRSNKNSIIRVVYSSGNYKMYMISTHKTYDGKISTANDFRQSDKPPLLQEGASPTQDQ